MARVHVYNRNGGDSKYEDVEWNRDPIGRLLTKGQGQASH